VAPAAKPPVLTVTQLNARIQGVLEETFPDAWVEGEISDPRTFPSGHTYFTLKDAESQISAVLFKGAASAVRFTLEHGLHVVARGRVTTYMKRGQYQFIVSRVEPKTAGALQLAFEQLKKRLESEGLFAAERKRPIPSFPERVGVVTSLQGAAVRDILTVLKRRFEGLHVRILPVPVQGAEAAPAIAQALADLNRSFPDTDVVLVGRGGGSLEDLWAFNEEAVARAIAASKIPVISCVGHETDFTIADFVADLRAPTPSAAAELVAPDKEAVRAEISSAASRLVSAMRGTLGAARERLAGLARSPALLKPARIVEQRAQRVDELASRLAPALRGRLARTEERLKPLGPDRLARGMRAFLELRAARLARAAQTLDALSPLKVLGRGYAIAFKLPESRVLLSSKDVRPRDRVKVRLGEGEFQAEVIP